MIVKNSEYWNDRYLHGDTPWDIGYASPALINYCQDLKNKDIHILIPGGGRAPEMSTLYKMGFQNVFLCDWSEKAIEEARRVNPELPSTHFICDDFFKIEGDFDLIMEQTFFCALDPSWRLKYITKTHELLRKKTGKLIGVFFDKTFEHEGPPFGGSKDEYTKLLEPAFIIDEFDTATDSIEPRLGFELFLVATAKT